MADKKKKSTAELLEQAILTIQCPGNLFPGFYADITGFSKIHPGFINLMLYQCRNDILYIQWIIGNPDEQKLKLPVIQLCIL